MLTPTPTAFSPGSITCFFVPSFGSNLVDAASPGCAINLSHGVTAAVVPAPSTAIRLNGQPLDFPPVRAIVERLAPEPVDVVLDTPLPLGCGFGVSAASVLTTAFALARRYDLDVDRAALGELALRTEIAHRTGIGDVVAQLVGGVVWRRWQSGPFDAVRLSLEGDVYYRSFGPLSTRDILTNAPAVRKIADSGRAALAWLEQGEVTLDRLLARSLQFAQEAGLVSDPRVLAAIAEVQACGGQATMVMLGQSVLATQPGAAPPLWHKCSIDRQGTRYLS